MLGALAVVQHISAQTTITFSVSQPPQLLVDAGVNLVYDGTTPAVLGGAPTATGGMGNYTYQWQPADLLDNPTSSNPMVTELTETTLFTVSVLDAGLNCVKQDQVLVELGEVGINDATLTNEVRIFPNPFQNKLTFMSGTKIEAITILDVSGKIIEKYNGIDEAEVEISAFELNAGIYFFNVQFSNGTQTIKRLCKID